MKNIFLILILLITRSEFVNAKILRAGAGSNAVLILEDPDLDGKSFRIVGRVSVTGFSRDEVLSKLQAKASRYKAEAIIAVKFTESSGTGVMVPIPNQKGNFAVPNVAQITAEGLLIIGDGFGIKTITDETVIPILK